MKKFVVILFCFIVQVAWSQNDEILTPEKHFRLADKLFAENNCESALDHVNKTIAFRVDDWDAYELRAMIYECLGKFEKALTDYSILVYQFPERAEFLFSRGELNYRNAKYEAAIDDLTKALELPVTETNKVYFSIATGDQGISGISTIKTMQAEMHNYIGLSFHELGEYDSAIYHFTVSIGYFQNSQYFNNRALSYMEMGNLEAATRNYEQALSINKYDQVAQYNLISLYGKQKKFKEQEVLLNEIGMDVKLPEIHVFKGVSAFQKGDYRNAIDYYDRAINLDKENEEYYIYRGQAYEKLKRLERAQNDYRHAIELKQNSSGAYFGLANTYYKMNELDSAIMGYDLAILYDPNFDKAYLNRGITYLRKKEFTKACPDIMKAKEYGLPEAEEMFRLKCNEN